MAEYVYGLERISQSRAGSVSVFLADGQGSIRELVDGAGTITDTYSYLAFGEELARTGSTENNFRFVGEEIDPNSGFSYNRARWYNMSSGRFVSVDPFAGGINVPVSLHRYLYANQSPVSFNDPTGKFTLMSVMSAIAVSNILASNAQPILKSPLSKTYTLVLYMLDYYDIGADGKKHTSDDVGITGFPGAYYSAVIEAIKGIFEQYSTDKAKFELKNSLGTKSFVSQFVKSSSYSAIVSHGSTTFPKKLFPSLTELKDNGLSAEHLTETELIGMSPSNQPDNMFISACNAGHWAEGELSAISKSSTEIGELMGAAAKWLHQKSMTE